MGSGLIAVGRSWGFQGVGYSPAGMAVADPPLTREAVLERVRARILGAARRDLSPADAEDLTQEALVLLTTKYAHVEAPEQLVALGVKIVRFKKSALWRKARRRREAGDVPVPAPAEDGTDPLANVASGDDPDAETIARDRQRVRLLAEAVTQLSGRCRDLLRRKLEGHSFVEIAARLGRPVNTIYSWDRRCHQRLRKLLGAQWGFVSGKEDA
jgi:RNA polymerase sigma factor (sigma-70 family)